MHNAPKHPTATSMHFFSIVPRYGSREPSYTVHQQEGSTGTRLSSPIVCLGSPRQGRTTHKYDPRRDYLPYSGQGITDRPNPSDIPHDGVALWGFWVAAQANRSHNFLLERKSEESAVQREVDQLGFGMWNWSWLYVPSWSKRLLLPTTRHVHSL